MKKYPKKLIYSIISIFVVVLLFYWFFRLFSYHEWVHEIGQFNRLGEIPVEYEIFLPGDLGYKDIRMIIPDIGEKYHQIQVKMSIVNKGKSVMHVVSKNYFVGKLNLNKKATIFDNSWEKLIKLYKEGDAPRIGNSKDNEKVLLIISSSSEIYFPKYVKIYAYAADSI